MREHFNLRADALLAAEVRPDDAPYFREFTFQYKLRRDSRRTFARRRPPADPMASLAIRAEWRQIIGYAKLTPLEEKVLHSWLAGDTFDVLAILNGSSKQAVYKCFSRALKKIRAAYDVYPFAGFADVFLSEIRRGRRTQNRRYTSD